MNKSPKNEVGLKNAILLAPVLILFGIAAVIFELPLHWIAATLILPISLAVYSAVTSTTAEGRKENFLRHCYMDMDKFAQIGEFEKTLKVANKLLEKFANDSIALQYKLISLIRLGLWHEALHLIDNTPTADVGDVHFEKAYIYYRTNCDEESLEELAKCDADDVRALELQAQILCRLGRFPEAFEVYQHILKHHSDEHDEERKSNLAAAQEQHRAMKQNWECSEADAIIDKVLPEDSNEVVNVDELEENTWLIYGAKYKQSKEEKEAIEKTDSEIVTGKLLKRKRKRTNLSKNFDPTVLPDPERWLPKEERAAYKKKRKNRERHIGSERHTQGSTAAPVEYKDDITTSLRPNANKCQPRGRQMQKK